MNLDKRKRIKGALIGAAYGDAYGMPSELWTPEKIQREYGEIREFLPGHPEHEISRGFSLGEVTDDTMNMVLVTEMLWEKQGEVDPYVFIQKLREWAGKEAKSKQVIGPSTAAAFALLDQGVSIELTGTKGTTNGGAMKILPIGIVSAGKPLEELLCKVQSLCLPTHNTSCAIAGAAAVAGAVAKAIEGEESLEDILLYGAEAAEAGERMGYPICSPSVSRRIAWALTLVKQEKPEKEILRDLYDLIGTGLPSSESVPAALALVLLSKGDPLVCARYAANIGGDTDTIGAMACGICGAYRGEDGFAQRETELLEHVNGIDFEALTAMLDF